MQLFSNSRTPAPVAGIHPSHDELVLRVNALAGYLAQAERRIAALEAAQATHASTALECPVKSPADCATGREVIRYIASRLGRGERAVAKQVESHSGFAPLRERDPNLTRNVKVLRWLAGEHDGQMRYSLIVAGTHPSALVRKAV